jgi:hypothetical protein
MPDHVAIEADHAQRLAEIVADRSDEEIQFAVDLPQLLFCLLLTSGVAEYHYRSTDSSLRIPNGFGDGGNGYNLPRPAQKRDCAVFDPALLSKNRVARVLQWLTTVVNQAQYLACVLPQRSSWFEACEVLCRSIYEPNAAVRIGRNNGLANALQSRV